MRNLLIKVSLGILASMFVIVAQGQTWESISTPVSTNLILQDISFPAGQSDIGYTGGTNVTYNGKGKVLKTTDGGDTWVVQWESEESGTGITSIYFETTMIGFAGTMAGNLLKTVDGGTNWTSTDIDLTINQGELTDMEFYDAENGVVLSQWEGIYVTSDGGDTWTVASTNYMTAQDVYYANSTTLFAVGGNQNIYKSTDGGDTWTFSFQGPNGGANQWINLGVYFMDANNGIVTSEEGQYFVTTDGGDTWTTESIVGQSGLMRGCYMVDTDNIYVCATPGEVFSTNDGGSIWTSEYYDFNPSFYKIKFTSNGTGFVCGSGSTGGTILKMDPNGLGIEEVAVNNWNVYPTPATNLINVNFELRKEGKMSINIINTVGQVVLTERLVGIVGSQQHRINLDNISEGSYILSLEMNGMMIKTDKIQIIR